MHNPKYNMAIKNDKKETFYNLTTKQIEKIYSNKNRYLYSVILEYSSIYCMGGITYTLIHTLYGFKIFMRYWGIETTTLLFDYNDSSKTSTLYPMSPTSYDVVKALSAVWMNKS